MCNSAIKVNGKLVNDQNASTTLDKTERTSDARSPYHELPEDQAPLPVLQTYLLQQYGGAD